MSGMLLDIFFTLKLPLFSPLLSLAALLKATTSESFKSSNIILKSNCIFKILNVNTAPSEKSWWNL